MKICPLLVRLFTLTFVAYGANALGAVAYVDQLTGTVTAQSGSGPQRQLKLGDLLDSGVTLTTGAKSIAVVKFEDGQIAVLEPETRFAIRQYNYNKNRIRESNVLFQVLQGGLRFVTGIIGSTNHDAFKVTAGTATIGVRGTDGTVYYDIIANVVTAAVNVGVLALQTPSGTVTIPTGTFSSAPPGAPASTPLAIAQATAAVAAFLDAARVVNVPINTPCVVELSARAVIAQAAAQAADAAAAANPGDLAAQQAAAAADAAAADALRIATDAAAFAFQQALANGAVPPTPPAPPITTGTVGQPPAPPVGGALGPTPSAPAGGGIGASPASPS